MASTSMEAGHGHNTQTKVFTLSSDSPAKLAANYLDCIKARLCVFGNMRRWKRERERERERGKEGGGEQL